MSLSRDTHGEAAGSPESPRGAGWQAGMKEKPSRSGQAFWDSWDSVSLPRATKHPDPPSAGASGLSPEDSAGPPVIHLHGEPSPG